MNHSLAKSECPSIEALSVLIDGNDDATDPDLLSHVDTCVPCQTRLDRLTEPTQLGHYGDFARSQSTIQQAFLGPPLRPGDLGSFNGFGIESELGAGGMGVVFRARDEQLGRIVALKVLTCATSPTALARFDRESQAASNLNHPNVVPIYSAGQSNEGRPYLVMPLIEGKSLKQAIQNNSLTFGESATAISQIADGLHHAHQAGLVHRDVKPANILVDQIDGRAKLVDFGLVRGVDDQTLTRTEMICGTPEYMSPEQANGLENADSRSDIYSLGISLYETLTGVVPFRGRPLDVLAQHRELVPALPGRLNKSIPRDLETICLKAIEKEPSSRYATAASLAADLQNFIDGRPIDAKPASSLHKTWRWARRNPRFALLSIAFVTALVGGILTTTWQWQSSRANYVEAQANYLAAQQNFDAATELILSHRLFALGLSRKVGHEIAARELYRKILQEVNQLVVLRNDDPEVRLLQPNVYLSNAEIESIVGNAEDSIQLFDRSQQLFQQLIVEKLEGLAGDESSAESNEQLPPVRDLQHSISAVVLLRGEAYHLVGETDRALEDYQTAKTTLIEIVKDISNPNHLGEKRNLALLLVLEGHVWSELADHGKALDCYQSAFQTLPNKMGLELKPSTHSESRSPELILPANRDYAGATEVEKHINAFVAHFLGRHLVATSHRSDDPARQLEEGIRWLNWSLEIRRDISEKNPDYSDWKRDVAMTLTELANAAQKSGQIESVNQRINESVTILSEMAQASDRLELRLRLAQALIIRSNLPEEKSSPDLRSSDLIRARALCQEVLAISPSWQECKRVLAVANESLAKEFE